MTKREITDEEIRELMDFQQVLDGHRKAVAKRSAAYWASGITAAIIVSVVVYFTTRPVETPSPQMHQPSTHSQPSIVVAPVDSTEKKVKKTTPVETTVIPSKTKEPRKPTTSQPKAAVAKADVYVAAEPIEGYPYLYKYFNDQLAYPQEAAKDSIQGVVSVTFIIRPTGAVDHITITNSLGPLFDAEAMRVMQGMPLWKPAQLNGKPVPSKMSVPLTFRIETTKK